MEKYIEMCSQFGAQANMTNDEMKDYCKKAISNTKTMETKRLNLRPWSESDAENLYEYAKDNRIGPICGWHPHKNVNESLEIIKKVLSKKETYAICLKTDNIAIGCISLMLGNDSRLKLPTDEAQVGYWIGVPFWGQGLVPEALDRLIEYSFNNLHLKKLWCGYFEGNIQSKRVQEKCGFIYHHTLKDIYWQPTNDIRTEHITILANSELLDC